jgi:hypothetical protein
VVAKGGLRCDQDATSNADRGAERRSWSPFTRSAAAARIRLFAGDSHGRLISPSAPGRTRTCDPRLREGRWSEPTRSRERPGTTTRRSRPPSAPPRHPCVGLRRSQARSELDPDWTPPRADAIDPVTQNHRKTGGSVQSGRLDLNQRPFGPQPARARRLCVSPRLRCHRSPAPTKSWTHRTMRSVPRRYWGHFGRSFR